MDTFEDLNYIAYEWSPHVRKSVIDVNTNLEIRTISFSTDMSESKIKNRKIEIEINYAYEKNVNGTNKILVSSKKLTTINLSTCVYAPMNLKSSGTLKTFHVHMEHYLGNDTEATNSYLWQIGAKYENDSSFAIIGHKCYLSLALNKADQYG